MRLPQFKNACRMFRGSNRCALVLRAAVMVVAFASSHAQAGATLSGKGLWDMLKLPEPKYSITSRGGGWRSLRGDWIDEAKLAKPLPENTIFEISPKLVSSPKGNEAFDRDTTADLLLLIHDRLSVYPQD